MPNYNILAVARGFPRCQPNRIPDKMPEDKTPENEKLDKMPDNPTCTPTPTLTAAAGGPFVCLFTHTRTLSISLHTLSISPLINTFLSFYTQCLYLSFSLHAHSL